VLVACVAAFVAAALWERRAMLQRAV